MSKCIRCGTEVFFDKSPEYDVCDECDGHICSYCGIYVDERGAFICKQHLKGE